MDLYLGANPLNQGFSIWCQRQPPTMVLAFYVYWQESDNNLPCFIIVIFDPTNITDGDLMYNFDPTFYNQIQKCIVNA